MCPPLACRASAGRGGPEFALEAPARRWSPGGDIGDPHGIRKVREAMATFDFKWWLEGTQPPRYLDLDASLAKFREQVNDALSREQLDVKVVPVTLMLARTVSYHGRIADEISPRAAELVRAIWQEGHWQVFESSDDTGKSTQK